MKRVLHALFLGKPLHWAALAVVAGVLYLVGRTRLQVTDFNLFTAITLAVAVAVLALVLATSRPGERVTRDPIPPPQDEG